MISIAALLYKTKDAVKKKGRKYKRENAQSVELGWLRHTQENVPWLLCDHSFHHHNLCFWQRKQGKAREREMSSCWDDSTCGLFLSSHLATTHLSILNPLRRTYRMYPATQLDSCGSPLEGFKICRI